MTRGGVRARHRSGAVTRISLSSSAILKCRRSPLAVEKSPQVLENPPGPGCGEVPQVLEKSPGCGEVPQVLECPGCEGVPEKSPGCGEVPEKSPGCGEVPSSPGESPWSWLWRSPSSPGEVPWLWRSSPSPGVPWL